MAQPPEFVEEVLCDRSREAQPYLAGYTDDPEMISKEWAEVMYARAFGYRAEANVGTEYDPSFIEFPGQAGLLRADQLVPSPGLGGTGGARYKVYPVTAKHCLHSGLGDLQYTKIYSPRLHKTQYVKFPEMGISKLAAPIVFAGHSPNHSNVELPYGYDFTFGIPIENPRNSFTGGPTSFEVVRHDFEIGTGQKIGIVVWRIGDLGTDDKPSELSLEDQKKYHGPPRVPVIQTGVITRVYGGGAVFEHNINTFEGCSGAVIFLLDQSQPDSVDPDRDHGKAIGVHAAGYRPQNLGMSIVEAFHTLTNGDALQALRPEGSTS